MEHKDDVSRRHLPGSLLGPLDQANGIVSEIFAKPCINELFWKVEPIEIKVIPVYPRNHINFNQCVGGAFYRTDMAERAQHGAHQGGLPGAEVAVEPDHHPRSEQGRQLAAKLGGRGVVGEMQTDCRLVIIAAMQEVNSQTGAASGLADGQGAYAAVAKKIKDWGQELGFAAIGIARADVSAAAPWLMRWLALGRHGEMDYMAKHAALRAAPPLLLPGALSVISVRLAYWPAAVDAQKVLDDAELAYVSRYALGRDYHKTVRQRLQKLADRLRQEVATLDLAEPFACRVFSDSAPVMETDFARQAGIAWRGKHTLSLTREGSWHFLGEIYSTLPLPPDSPITEHCGDCRRCLDACPTAAIVAPYEVDARLCISYLTIELHGTIPVALRPLIGTRIYGCDDCQLCCPWNRFAQIGDPDFAVRNGLDATPLTTLFAWSEEDFNNRLAGSPIRRIGHLRWLRNIAVALGNAPRSPAIIEALCSRQDDPSPLLREHVAWALAQQHSSAG
jgi:epoxyqueuosine reductase